ncbi:putative tail fiber protein [Shigella phage Silverhawkium]|uniref:Putative tail fiber protein n=1 Tax=Shigella phage Silverhawkium TaxID=2530185 RepID=A0A482JGS7_9CAUD|nr:putative tail fiber protein [Shigella phage Silverhawkium]
MAVGEIQISALPQASLPIDMSDIFHLKQGIEDKRCTLEQLLAPHASLKNNPHGVTKSQVGLSSVINALQLVAANNLSDVVSVEEARTNLGILSSDEVNALIQAHIDDKNNPHNVTKIQVGLGNIQNWTYTNSYSEDADKYASARAVNALYRAIQNSYPIGTIHLSVNPANPATYLLCGGTWELVSKGRSLVGYDSDERPVESVFGSSTVSLTQNNIPSHTHSVYLTGGGHTHGATVSISSFDYGSKNTSSYDYGSKATTDGGNHAHNVNGSVSSAGNHSHRIPLRGNDRPGSNGITASSDAGVGNASYTDFDGVHTHTFNVNSSAAGNHNHSVYIGAHSHSVAIGAHSHSGTVTVQSSEHTHSGTTGAFGSGQAFNIEQPSYVVYVWKRTA